MCHDICFLVFSVFSEGHVPKSVTKRITRFKWTLFTQIWWHKISTYFIQWKDWANLSLNPIYFRVRRVRGCVSSLITRYSCMFCHIWAMECGFWAFYNLLTSVVRLSAENAQNIAKTVILIFTSKMGDLKNDILGKKYLNKKCKEAPFWTSYTYQNFLWDKKNELDAVTHLFPNF